MKQTRKLGILAIICGLFGLIISFTHTKATLILVILFEGIGIASTLGLLHLRKKEKERLQ